MRSCWRVYAGELVGMLVVIVVLDMLLVRRGRNTVGGHAVTGRKSTRKRWEQTTK